MMRKRVYIAGKSGDSWYQLPPATRRSYKRVLAKKYGSRCNPGHNFSLIQGVDHKYFKFGCGRHFPITLLTVDHVIPISKGGPVFDIENMQLLCWQCHRKKTMENDMIDA
jgi:5-methylcytosine-specific restriction endonuclease McrA